MYELYVRPLYLCNPGECVVTCQSCKQFWMIGMMGGISHEELKSGNDTSRHLVFKQILDRPKMCQSQVTHLFMNLCTYLQGASVSKCHSARVFCFFKMSTDMALIF